MSFDIEFRKQGEGAIGFIDGAHGIEFTSDRGNRIEHISGGRRDPVDGWTIDEAIEAFDVVVVEHAREDSDER